VGDPENGGRFTVKKYHSERLGARLHRSCQIDFPLAFGQQYSKLAP
jgi:hypothetical protein